MITKYQSLYVNISDKRQARTSTSSRFFGNFAISLVIILLLVVGLGKIYLDRQIKKMVREWQSKNEQLNLLKKESQNLILEQEKFMSGNHILVEAEKLNLKPPEPGQIRRIHNSEMQSKFQQTKKPQNSMIAAK